MKGGDDALYARIKFLAETYGISIHRLEIECSFGGGTICRWDAHSPSIDAVKKVAQFFGITIDELLYGDLKAIKRKWRRDAKGSNRKKPTEDDGREALD